MGIIERYIKMRIELKILGKLNSNVKIWEERWLFKSSLFLDKFVLFLTK
ncbi:hypothetical protein HMPREF1552_01021 [Leptotrichia sp. oral taxon 879 str. F0557]|nr:hypothetical protein HMPREF1552_01021 [Leptotrichia sp. oral taxon 879 str. F0557]